MGRGKQEWIESQERGWDAPEAFVCSDCVEDAFLKDIIKKNVVQQQCSYCERCGEEDIAAPVESIMPAISSALYYYFNDPDSACVPYDGGYVFEANTTTEEALDAISLECQEDLLIDIAGAFHNDLWIETEGGHWNGTHYSDSMAYAWERFIRTVKHECRYFFTSQVKVDDFSGELHPLAVLTTVREIIGHFKLFQSLPVGTDLFRVRVRSHGEPWELNEQELGPPPNEKANAGRMNPAGISYFYLAQDSQTALAEVIAKPPCIAVVASFKTCQEMLLLDLCNLPAVPSVFDGNRHEEREMIYFLRHFVREISQPIAKNGQEHIDYVPSQVISEYFAKEFRTIDGQSINGLMYPSTVRPGGTNIVLFPLSEGHRGFAKLVEFVQAKEITMVNWNKLIDQLS